MDAHSPVEDGYEPSSQVVRDWAIPASLNDWATNQVRNRGWTFLAARGVVDQAEDLMTALRRHADASGEDPFDQSFPTAHLIEPSILLDEPEETAGAGEDQ